MLQISIEPWLHSEPGNTFFILSLYQYGASHRKERSLHLIWYLGVLHGLAWYGMVGMAQGVPCRWNLIIPFFFSFTLLSLLAPGIKSDAWLSADMLYTAMHRYYCMDIRTCEH